MIFLELIFLLIIGEFLYILLFQKEEKPKKKLKKNFVNNKLRY